MNSNYNDLEYVSKSGMDCSISVYVSIVERQKRGEKVEKITKLAPTKNVGTTEKEREISKKFLTATS